jgi:hypothetical protein
VTSRVQRAVYRRTRLEPEDFELGWRQGDARDGVDPAPRQMLPDQFDLRKRHTRLPQEGGERVEPLALGMAAAKPASQRREDDPVLGIDGIDITMNSRDVQETRECFGHRS